VSESALSPSQSPVLVQLPTIVIEPSTGWVSLKLRELWGYRELLYFLIWRDVKVRYKQTVLGGAWAVLQPFLTMVVFSIIFGRLAKVPSDGIAYPVFAFTALLPWQLFAHALNDSANSLVTNQQLITKVYFPRLVIPMAAVLAGLVDFTIGFVVLVGMMLYYGILPGFAILTLPLFLLLTIAVALAVGLWLSALNVQYRDVRHTIPFLTQFWLLITPIAYSSSLIPERWRSCYGLNPMAGAVEGFRWALLGSTGGGIPVIAVSIFVACVLLLGGLFYFRRMERTFSDVI
jgi:lipopolysaccharide transport system permease protein